MHDPGEASAISPGAAYLYSLGLLRARRIRRILALAGFETTTGWPGAHAYAAAWGQKPVARRAHWVARHSKATLLTLEDGFLRSLDPGVTRAPPISLIMDDVGIYYDASRPSRLERLLQDGASHETRQRASDGIAALRRARLSKYTPPVAPLELTEGYVLVVDQTAGDASIAGAGAGPETFERMLHAARHENPGARIVIKSHPDVLTGRKRGHFKPQHARPDDQFLSKAVNPWDAINGASAVYTVSSQLGYEAILAGKRVRTFGMAFYSGWGLTVDEATCTRRSSRLSAEVLFAACHLRYPVYYDPWYDRLCEFERAVEVLSHQLMAETPPADTSHEAFAGIRLWKRRNVAKFRPRLTAPPRYFETPQDIPAIADSKTMAWLWASKFALSAREDLSARGVKAGFVEDGFLRSVGLGAALTEPASLVFDRQGIYFDPSQPSDLENLIARAADGTADLPRARALRDGIVAAKVSKYNVGQSVALPPSAVGREVLLVPGQVEDDASILRGCGAERTNFALLQAARRANPEAFVIYKPHPDVEAGLRAGAIPAHQAQALADWIALDAAAPDLIEFADGVWTLTSLLGFEALMREKPVTCLGMPFYAGWGLTCDVGPSCPRRIARPSLDALVWAALIAYPVYRDPVSGLACPPELIVERLATGVPTRRAGMLSKLQALFAGQSWLWRR